MTARPSAAAGSGFCVPCYAAGVVSLAVDPAGGGACAAHRAGPTVARLAHPAATVDGGDIALETTRSGQDRLAMRGVPRRPYATGVQVSCARCAEHGIDKLGMPDRFPGDPTPLCRSCWRSEQQRRARAEAQRQVAQAWEEVGEAAVCPVCGPGQPGHGGRLPAIEDLLSGPALDVVQSRRQHRGVQLARPVRGGCWWCGDRAWLESQRWQFEQDQAAAAEAEAARVEAEFERMAAVAEAEAVVADLTGWRERLHNIATGYVRGNSWGRAVELSADAYARLDAARTSRRGRPPVVARLVATVLAADSDCRTGRRALPGRERTAELIGYSDRAVYDAWQLLAGESVGWARRTRVGGRNSLQRRIETGRWNDRGEFDIHPLTHSPIDPAVRARYVPEALAMLGQLLERAQQLLDTAQAELDDLRAAAERAPGWGAELACRAQARQATRQVLAAVTSPDAAVKITRNICRSHPVTRGECVNSCPSWGLRFSRPIMIHSRRCRAGQPAEGRSRDGASRSSTRAGLGDLERRGPSPARPTSPPLDRPRTRYVPRSTSRPSRARVRPDWADFAPGLARDLIPRLPWLGGVRRPAVAAVLGARLGPDWTAPAVLAWLAKTRTRPLLDNPDNPLAYLAAVLDQALTGDAEPPHPARRHAEHRHQVAAATSDTQRDAQAARRAELDARDAAAASGETRAAGVAAARAAIRRHQPAAPAVSAANCDWPEPAKPGGGVDHLRPSEPHNARK
ncbi:hypothetical protein ACFFX1_11235 [Dactylosporangium sucinum]|uniref:Uncharacterized protein n=1 Tax=Dactylosporangium sucinum TaxID=1424081 RepID=A0A917TG66_9ACTN|nr:hypothetical protein [Dactylosporangium sucinum]GGM22276.1 hypothetical protein GCM10007977_024300 [Dactylosporangium sucinum]